MQKSFTTLLFCLLCPLFIVAQSQTSSYSIKKVVIDAGHGGKDPGAVGYNGIKEKDVALAIAIKTGNYIKEFVPGVEVIYTRSTDKFIELYQRAKIANKADADLFISIHANSVKNKSKVHGTETFVLGTHKDASNLAVAKRENASILMEKDYLVSYSGFDPNKPETHIILSLIQSAYKEESTVFAGLVENQFESRAKRFSRGVKSAGFMVLHKTTMPSVLVETGFISNKKEALYLASEKGQNEIASAIYRAFKSYKEMMEGESTKPQTASASKPETANSPKPKTPAPPKVIKEAVVESEAKIKKTPPIKKASPPSKPIVSTGNSSTRGTYRIELYSSDRAYKGSSKKLNDVGEIVVEYNSSKGIRKFMMVDKYQEKTRAQSKLKELKESGFVNAQLILYQNGRRIVQ